MYSSHSSSVFTNWGDYFDPESGIVEYVVSVLADGEEKEQFKLSAGEYQLEDHTLHFKHGETVEV